MMLSATGRDTCVRDERENAEMIAEQNVECIVYRQDSLPDIIVRLGVRVQVPVQGYNAGHSGVTIEYRAMPLEPEDWHYTLTDRISDGVHAGIASVDAPLPMDGMRVIITYPSLYPVPASGPSEDEQMRFGELAERAVAGAIEVLWKAIISFDPVYESSSS